MTEKKRPVGRPRTQPDPETVMKLARLGLTYKSIADYCGVSSSTIEKNFSAIIKEAHAQVGMNIRQRLVERAMHEDDKSCQIYLDKKFNRDADSGGNISPDPVKKINLSLVDK